MPSKNDFFDHRNKIESVSDFTSQKTVDYLGAIVAFSRATYTSIYVIDYQKQGFEYVSNNPLFLCGNSAEEVQKMGYEFYFKYVPEKDLELLLKVNDVGFDFYEKIPLSERLSYAISYDYHILNQEGKPILINQKLTPLFLTEEGKIWKAICIVSLSGSRNMGNIQIYKTGNNLVHHYDLEKECWIKKPKVSLKKRELEILQLTSRGLTINEIADNICVLPDTVKFHRRQLFEKLDVKNISEALAYVTNNKLI